MSTALNTWPVGRATGRRNPGVGRADPENGGQDYVTTNPTIHKAGKKIEITVKKRQAGEFVDVTIAAYTTATPGLVVHKAVTGKGYILAHENSAVYEGLLAYTIKTFWLFCAVGAF